MSLEQWESYYRNGMIATGPTGPDGGYDGEVHAAWVEFFSTLPDQASILDIGTGNGVIALIAAETAKARGLTWEIHATDLARIDPLKHVPDGMRRLAGISFHAGVASERLPFAAESFDAVSGHYALEYSETAAALAEVHRVLKPGTDAQFILHNADSVLIDSARRSLHETDIVLVQTKIYRRLHRLVSMDRATPAAATRAMEELRSSIRTLKHELIEAQKVGAGRVLSVALDAVQKLLAIRAQASTQSIGLDVDRAEAEMRASAKRLHDLLAHARTAQDMDVIQNEAAAAGFTLIERMPQFYAGTNLIGWQLLLHRA
ncbi:MAG: class I SAM-dependent methyltransferase [Xanthomonadaceae bacterium]|nr:class I SAM-dependent methyltransferase [Xanthomonadaceae bacterium]